MKNQEEQESSVFRALGIDEEWEILNDHRLEKDFNSSETVSDTMIAMAKRIKKEEFGETGEISLYERKIMASSLTLAQMIIQKRTMGGLHAMLLSQLSQMGNNNNGEKED